MGRVVRKGQGVEAGSRLSFGPIPTGSQEVQQVMRIRSSHEETNDSRWSLRFCFSDSCPLWTGSSSNCYDGPVFWTWVNTIKSRTRTRPA